MTSDVTTSEAPMATTPDVDLTTFTLEELVARRAAIDARIDAIKSEFVTKAEILGLKVTAGRKKGGRRPRAQSVE